MNKLISKNVGDRVIVMCDCGGDDHHISIMRDQEDGEFYFTIMPLEHGLWYRFKWGLKYIFGIKDCWDDIVVMPEQMKELLDTLTELYNTPLTNDK